MWNKIVLLLGCGVAVVAADAGSMTWFSDPVVPRRFAKNCVEMEDPGWKRDSCNRSMKGRIRSITGNSADKTCSCAGWTNFQGRGGFCDPDVTSNGQMWCYVTEDFVCNRKSATRIESVADAWMFVAYCTDDMEVVLEDNFFDFSAKWLNKHFPTLDFAERKFLANADSFKKSTPVVIDVRTLADSKRVDISSVSHKRRGRSKKKRTTNLFAIKDVTDVFLIDHDSSSENTYVAVFSSVAEYSSLKGSQRPYEIFMFEDKMWAIAFVSAVNDELYKTNPSRNKSEMVGNCSKLWAMHEASTQMFDDTDDSFLRDNSMYQKLCAGTCSSACVYQLGYIHQYTEDVADQLVQQCSAKISC